MNMDEFKPNSNRSKEEQTRASDKRVTRGVAAGRTRKKSEIRKITDIFIPEDISTIKDSVIYDIVVPMIKRVISDTVDAILYPGGGPRRGNTTASKVSYSGYYNRSDRDRREPRTDRVRSGLDYDDIVFETRGDAEAVLSAMEDVIDQYRVVSVADLYDLAQVSTHNYSVNNYGWTDLRSAQAVRVRDGWVLKLPRALPIN